MSATTPVVRQANLFYRGGSSDKVYQVTITETEGGFNVDGWNARRGDPLIRRPQNKTPVDRETADKLFDKLVTKKKNDRETPYKEEAQTAQVTYEAVETSPGRGREHVQLLTEIETVKEATKRILDPNYDVEIKYDGHRLRSEVCANSVTGYKRNGESRPVASTTARDLRELARAVGGAFEFDGELIGERYYIFDLLRLGTNDMRPLPRRQRYDALRLLLRSEPGQCAAETVRLAAAAFTKEGKVALAEEAFNRRLEGIVLKHVESPYETGRRGDQFKFKYTTEGSFVVVKMNERNSVNVGVYDNGKLIDCGNVTIRSRIFTPKPGDVLDIKYLYATESNHLYQPRMVRSRDDMKPEGCLLSQLKYKGLDVDIPVIGE